MKDRVREAVFNLVGVDAVGAIAIDLFAGTGALGLEALSRGARRAVFVEQHRPTAALIQQNIALLGAAEQSDVRVGDALRWAAYEPIPINAPWVVFVSPPWELFEVRGEELLELIRRMIERAPPASVVVVEADSRFDMARLPAAADWDVRKYHPAVVAVGRLRASRAVGD